jgi:hypothetical protein
MIRREALPRIRSAAGNIDSMADSRFKELVMKSIFAAMVVSAAFAIPAVSFAQSDVSTPAAPVQTVQSSGVGGVADGTSASGAANHQSFGARVGGIFRHANAQAAASNRQCVGPASYCTVFFGS